MRTHRPSDRTLPPFDPCWRIGIVYSSYYPEEVGALRTSARTFLERAGLPAENIIEHSAPGSFEIPLIGAALAEAHKVDALIGFGIIVEGETHPARLLAEQEARAISDVQLRFLLPFAFEVLYVRELSQARARGERGGEAAAAVLASLAELGRLRS